MIKYECNVCLKEFNDATFTISLRGIRNEENNAVMYIHLGGMYYWDADDNPEDGHICIKCLHKYLTEHINKDMEK